MSSVLPIHGTAAGLADSETRVGGVRYGHRTNAILLGLALCAVPVSIAVAEAFLAASLLWRTAELARHRAQPFVPRVFWFWLAWAALEVIVWLRSPEIRAGWGEIRHLLLIASLFLALPALDRVEDRVAVWRGIFATATVNSMFLIATFVSRLLYYRGELDPIVYLRTGGLLHHWMIYGIVEILVFGGLLEFLHLYPEERRWCAPVLAINSLAILLSLTRMLWICCLLLLVLHLAWRRSRWIWAVPAIPLMAFFLAPGPIRTRVTTSMHPDYYSNAERVQMLRVGWRMILDSPMTGVGPGLVEAKYRDYLSQTDPVPAYYGHLHNNLVQLAAEFGLPVTGAALLFVAALFHDLLKRHRRVIDRGNEFLLCTAVLGLIGFLAAGMFDYTYGHSLGLILLGFVVLMPLIPVSHSGPRLMALQPAGGLARLRVPSRISFGSSLWPAAEWALAAALSIALLPVLTAISLAVAVASGKSPLIAHRRMGRYGQEFWMLKVRTMWDRSQPPLPGPAIPQAGGWTGFFIEHLRDTHVPVFKGASDPRVTSRLAVFCRRFSLDELPQLIHVLSGRMRLVGPRPITRAEWNEHYGASSLEVLSVSPGMTGMWQVMGRNRLTYGQRRRLDLFYARHQTPQLDLMLLWRTPVLVLRARDAG
jgi:lipopolysaccharide/colanic/teichoic acid biosynthesis glycosyltransferase/O-antigen ligase